jgi:hypothetical protein
MRGSAIIKLGYAQKERDTMSAVPPTPNGPPVGESRRFFRRIGSFIIRVRRAGVPHEETVIIPAVALDLIPVFWKSDWPLWIPGTSIIVIIVMCSAWLAFAWRGFPIIRVFLRPLYIGVLSAGLWIVTHDIPDSKHYMIDLTVKIWLIFGPLFYFGYGIAGMIRDDVLGIFYSERQKVRYFERREWRRSIWRFVREPDNLKEASGWNWIIASLLRSVLTDIKGLLALIGFIISAVWVIVNIPFGLPTFLSGH